MIRKRLWRLTAIGTAIIFLFSVSRLVPAHAQMALNYITLNYWPVDAPNWYVLDYPDTEWTWTFLGLNPDKGCPPYLIHDRAKSSAYWRDPSLPEDVDWNQASHGNGWVSCYRGHTGTDIAAPAFSPVYAAADGEVIQVRDGGDKFGDNGVVKIEHHREIAGYVGDWVARYVHLANNFPVTSGPVREGQLIGYVANRGRQTHIHYEMNDLWGCHAPCIVNPWGPTYLFFDDDYDRHPDPGSTILAPALADKDVVANGDFADGWLGWSALSGSGEAIQPGSLLLLRKSEEDRPAGVQQIIPYSLPPDTEFEIRLVVENASALPSSLWVSLRDIRGFDRQAGRAFYLPAQSSESTLTFRATTDKQWANLVLLISASQVGGGLVKVDSVSLRVIP